MAAKKMILISQEKYDRLMRTSSEDIAHIPVEQKQTAPPTSVNRKRKAPSTGGKRKQTAPPTSVNRKLKVPSTSGNRKLKAPPPGEPSSKLARRVLKFKRY